jgi:repressor LexA
MPRKTDRADRILKFIESFRAKHGWSPTFKEIMEELDTKSVSSVQHHLRALREKGLIVMDSGKFRAMRASGDESQARATDDLGVISAGRPIPVPDDTASVERIYIPEYIARGRKKLFALHVRGNSMVDALIANGDVVILEPTNGVKSGDLVAVWLKKEQEVTLKQIFFQNGRTVRLQPCNPTMIDSGTIILPAEDIVVQGKVVGVMRSM